MDFRAVVIIKYTTTRHQWNTPTPGEQLLLTKRQEAKQPETLMHALLADKGRHVHGDEQG